MIAIEIIILVIHEFVNVEQNLAVNVILLNFSTLGQVETSGVSKFDALKHSMKCGIHFDFLVKILDIFMSFLCIHRILN